MSIEERVDRLERSSRRWRLLAIGLLGALALGLFSGAEPDDPVGEATQVANRLVCDTLIVHDALQVGSADGKRISMSFAEEGCFLTMHDSEGRRGWRTAAKSNGSYAQLYNTAGKVVWQRKAP